MAEPGAAVGAQAGGDPIEPTVLVVGSGDAQVEAVVSALVRHRIAVERTVVGDCRRAAMVAAPDAILLVGDAAHEQGRTALDILATSPLTSVLPAVVLTADDTLEIRMAALHHGANGVVALSASVDATAQRIASAVRELAQSEGGPRFGRVGEATLDDFVRMVARELKSGIVSVRGGEGAAAEEIRLVLGEGEDVTATVTEFVERVKKLVERADVVKYELHDEASRLSLGAAAGKASPSASDVSGTRVLLADSDAARADAVATELRAAGCTVVVIDLEARGLPRARAFDPHAVVLAQEVLEGERFDVVRTLRADVRLRWAHMIVVGWDEIWSERKPRPDVSRLLARIARSAQPEREVLARVATGQSIDIRLEALGPARLIRALGGAKQPARVTCKHVRGHVRIDLLEGLVIGARADRPRGGTREGVAALAAWLGLARGRVRIAPSGAPEAANVMMPAADALGAAELERISLPPESPGRDARGGGDGLPVATARTLAPPQGEIAKDAVPAMPPQMAPARLRAGGVDPHSAPTPAAIPMPKIAPPVRPPKSRHTLVGIVAPPSDERRTPAPAPVATPPKDPHAIDTVPAPTPGDRVAKASAPKPAAVPREAPAHEPPAVAAKTIDEATTSRFGAVPPAVEPPSEPTTTRFGAVPPPIAPPAEPPAEMLAPPSAIVSSAATPREEAEPPARTPSIPAPSPLPALDRLPSPRAAKSRRARLVIAGGIAAAALAVLAVVGIVATRDRPSDARAARPAPPRPAARAAGPDERSTVVQPPAQDDSARARRPSAADDGVPPWVERMRPIMRERRARQLIALAARDVRAGRHAQALRKYHDAQLLAPANSDAFAGTARIHLARHNRDEAVEWAQRAVALEPTAPRHHVLLGDALVEARRFEDALAAFEEALRLAPSHRAARRKAADTRRRLRAASR